MSKEPREVVVWNIYFIILLFFIFLVEIRQFSLLESCSEKEGHLRGIDGMFIESNIPVYYLLKSRFGLEPRRNVGALQWLGQKRQVSRLPVGERLI